MTAEVHEIVIVLAFASFLLILVPRTVDAKSAVILDSNQSGTDQYYYSLLDACTPFSYHSHDNVTEIEHGVLNASKTSTQTFGCARELNVTKGFCEGVGESVKPCSDPRFTNFLVNVYGTPAFAQAYETQHAAVVAQSMRDLSHPCPNRGEVWSEPDQKCYSLTKSLQNASNALGNLTAPRVPLGQMPPSDTFPQ